MKKVLIAASSGGHLEEAMALKPLKDYYQTVLITEKTEYGFQPWQDRCYLMPQLNRRKWKYVLRYPGVFVQTYRILKKEKPDAVLATGAMISFPALVLAKLMGIKTIFIECMFNVTNGTATGKLAYRFCDLFIVQWESMLQVYPKAVLGGRVF